MEHTNPSIAVLTSTICSILGIRKPSLSGEKPLEAVLERVGREYRICLLVIDSLGKAQIDFHSHHLPYLHSIMEQSCTTLRAESPPRTSANVASLLTGAPPSVHGVTSKSMDLKCESIFDCMAMCALKTSVVAREKPSLRCLLSQRTSDVSRISEGDDRAVFQRAERVIQELQPHFIWIHLSDLDRLSHSYGSESAESAGALMQIDRSAEALASLLYRHSYAMLITADHGQHSVRDEHGGMTAVHDGSDESDYIVPLLSVPAPQKITLSQSGRDR